MSRVLLVIPFLCALLGFLLFIPPPSNARADEPLLVIQFGDAGPESLPVAAPVVVPGASSEIELYAAALIAAAHSPQKSLVLALILMGIVFALREYGSTVAAAFKLPKVEAFLTSDRAGPLFVLLLSGLGAIATALAAGQPLSFPLILTAAGIGLKAIGVYVGAKKVTAATKGAP